ncbi:sn-glycerol-3-phosphate ABC transporter ATP-binding protein UgpC [Bartonella sp. HY406]|uniref:sn-glycerol-3-phosphate ABC transporter ATP-binding protein UgpC n=1 Tax=Bartonella sp. HY406 TaxID=2979331 RepID=UPI0021C704B0|nr:sn-glycerol-3-phosphate ABC transporter ATP-binding protein UgpC [Bartonella sp. HY406]UXN03659.1 sn-glycerol-3-phosphate ABC transporter ATP-binding protein UgpC [Bartonella sp. HY406]
MASIKLSNIKKQYDNGITVIEGLNLSVNDGELVVLVGPSGCGKSTLLRMVAGLEQISGGELYIGDKLVNNIEPAERDIAMVFQNYALYPHMSVRGNLEYGLKNRKTPKDERDRRIMEAAKMLEIEPFLDRKPRQLSGGQRQRVAMGRAIVRKPKLFLFDEPLSNLDAKLRGQMRVEIKTLQRRLKTTSLYVTHDQLEAMTLADKLVVMNKGKIEQMGLPVDIYDKPKTLFVASFIGSPQMNFLDRSVLSAIGGDGMVFSKEADYIGFRPGAVSLGEPRQDCLNFNVKILLVELIGAGCQILVEWQGQQLTIELPDRLQQNNEGNLQFSVSLKDLHPFNKQSGLRVED